jgi:hypothetical protein
MAAEECLPELPDELIHRIALLAVRRGGLREWCRSWRAVSTRFAPLHWFEEGPSQEFARARACHVVDTHSEPWCFLG